jgi:hypothetical protein
VHSGLFFDTLWEPHPGVVAQLLKYDDVWDNWCILDKHSVEYSDHGGLLYSCYDDVWDNWCILDYSLILWGATSNGSSTIINTPFLSNYHTDKLMIGDKHSVEYSDHGGLLYSCFDDLLVYKDHQIDFLCPQDGEFINYTVMAWWYFPLELVSGEAKHVRNKYYFFNHHLVRRAWNDTIFKISGG